MVKENLSPYKVNADHEGLYYYNAKGEKVYGTPQALANAVINEVKKDAEEEVEEMTRERMLQALTENEVENMSSRDLMRMIYEINDEKSNKELMEEYNECHSYQGTIIDSFDLDKKFIDEDNAREVFMKIFRSDLLNTLSTDDRHEVFSSILQGSSDFTVELFEDMFNNYDIDNLEVIEISTQPEK
jgi:nucleoside diphosphate kinase